MGHQRVDGGSSVQAALEAARRRAEEAARRAAEEARRRAAEAARQAAAKAAAERSRFDAPEKKKGPKIEAQGTSLLTENANDKKVNCLDRAADWVNKATPELRGRSELVFLDDTRKGAEGDTGHVVIRQGNRVFDPTSGKGYEDMNAYLAEQPQYETVGTLPANSAAKIFATEAGSPERAKAIEQAKVSPALQQMMVADNDAGGGGGGGYDVPDITAKPHDVNYPVQAGPVSVEFSDTLDNQVEKKDGYVTVKIEAETSGSASATLDLKKIKVGGGISGGKTVSYEVKMKEEDYEKMKRGEIPPPHPLDPSTLPDGGSIKLEQSQFTGTSLEVGFAYHAAELGISSEIKEGEGLSLEVTRNGDKVSVTAGPTEFIENDGKVSLGVGPVSVSMGRTDTLTEYKLRTAEFDISTQGGKDAFAAFRESGKLPEKEAAGVSNTLRIDKLTYESAGSVGLDLGPFSLEGSTGTNTGDMILTHHPDGTQSMTMDVTYGGDHPDLTIERKFDKDGELIEGSEKFALKFDTKDDNARELLVYSFTGDADKAKAARENDQPITLNLTASEMRQLQERAVEPEMHHMGLGGIMEDYDGKLVEPWYAARTMACSPTFNEYRLATEFWGLYVDSGKTQPLPGELTIG